MGASEFNVGGTPAMDCLVSHPGGVEYTQLLNATETGINSGGMNHLTQCQSQFMAKIFTSSMYTIWIGTYNNYLFACTIIKL